MTFFAPDPAIKVGKYASSRFMETSVSFSQGVECSLGGQDTEHQSWFGLAEAESWEQLGPLRWISQEGPY